MPFRLDPKKYGEFRAKIQFTTAVWMPKRIYEACVKTNTLSATVYCQRAVCEALARDLDLNLDELLASLPRARGPAAHLFDPDEAKMDHTKAITIDSSGGRWLVGPANTIEQVK